MCMGDMCNVHFSSMSVCVGFTCPQLTYIQAAGAHAVKPETKLVDMAPVDLCSTASSAAYDE
jgi:hypothetical protein